MLSPEIKSIFSSDVELDVWQPATDADVCFLVEMEIGEVGQAAADQFSVIFATPDGLKGFRAGEDVILDRGVIVLRRFSWDAVHGSLESILRGCKYADWVGVTDYLQRYFHWEYEDMNRSRPANRLELRSIRTDDESMVWTDESGLALSLVETRIGLVDEADEDVFEVTFATPEGLKCIQNDEHDDVISTRGVIVVPRLSKPAVRRRLEAILRQSKCRNWDEAGVFLRRYFVLRKVAP